MVSPTSINPFAVHLFTNYVGDRQFSMLRYSTNLESSLRTYAGAQCSVQCFTPAFDGKSPGPLRVRWKRHVEFPWIARRHSGEINHIVDHGNSHLINYLPHDRTIITCHDLIPLRLSSMLKGVSKRIKYSFWAKAIQMKKAAKIMADSESTRQDIVQFLGIHPDKIQVVYLGINDQIFRPMEPTESKTRFREKFKFDWPLTLLHVGAPAFYKNLEGIIETLAILRQQNHLDIHLVRVGSPLTAEQRQLMDQRGVAASIHTVNPEDDAELRELYLAADILIFPSWWEGFGWPPLEALACGTPVVISNRGSLPECVGPAALQVRPEDAQGLASAVRQLLDDGSLRERLQKLGYTQVSKFKWKNTAEQAAQIYQDVRSMAH